MIYNFDRDGEVNITSLDCVCVHISPISVRIEFVVLDGESCIELQRVSSWLDIRYLAYIESICHVGNFLDDGCLIYYALSDTGSLELSKLLGFGVISCNNCVIDTKFLGKRVES